VPDDDRLITEAEYRAWVPGKMAGLAEQFTAALPEEAREAGLRVEWAPLAEIGSAGAEIGHVNLPCNRCPELGILFARNKLVCARHIGKLRRWWYGLRWKSSRW
jgi:hypothetical protein